MENSITVTCYSQFDLDKEVKDLESKGYRCEGGVTINDVSTEEDKKSKDYASQQTQYIQKMVLDEESAFINPNEPIT